jgi:hypothetical protein
VCCGGVEALECCGIVLHALKLGAERRNGCIGLGHRRRQSVGLELKLGVGLFGVLGVQKRLEEDVARRRGNGGWVAFNLVVVVCQTMKPEAGNLPPVEGDDASIRRRDLLQRLNGVDVVEVSVGILGSHRREEGGLSVGCETVEAAIADGAAAAANKEAEEAEEERRRRNVLVGGAQVHRGGALRLVVVGSIDGGEGQRQLLGVGRARGGDIDKDGCVFEACDPHWHVDANLDTLASARDNAVHLTRSEAAAGKRACWFKRVAKEDLDVCIQGTTEEVEVVGAVDLLRSALPRCFDIADDAAAVSSLSSDDEASAAALAAASAALAAVLAAVLAAASAAFAALADEAVEALLADEVLLAVEAVEAASVAKRLGSAASASSSARRFCD